MPRRVHILADELLDNFVVLGRILDIRQLDSLFRAAGLLIAATIKGAGGPYWATRRALLHAYGCRKEHAQLLFQQEHEG